MAKSTSHNPGLSPIQIECILNDVANSANAIRRLSIMQTHEIEDPENLNSVATAIVCLSERIGLLADYAADFIPNAGGPLVGVDPAAWMMPPVYHYAKNGKSQ